MIDLETKDQFLDVLQLNKAIIYLLVNWSGGERVSRNFIYKAFSEIDKKETLLFKIDCSDQEKEYVVDWLIGQEQKKQLFYDGWGATLFLQKGKITDVIPKPLEIEFLNIKERLEKWCKL